MGRRTVRRIQRSRSKQDRVQKQTPTPAAAEHPLMDLQRSIGSQGIQRLIGSPYIQTKLQVSSPEDQAERQADRAAEGVMRSAETGNASSAASAGNQTAQTAKNADPSSVLETRLENQRAAQPLPRDVRDFMEPRLGADLSDVKVHTGKEAANLSNELHAQAFTHGDNVYFGAGKSPRKDALTAHELAHVIQQTGAAPLPGHTHGTICRSSSPSSTIALKGDPADRSYWFQDKPPQKPTTTKEGIEIAPKGQVVLDRGVVSVKSAVGTVQIQFAGLDSDFQGGAPTGKFAAGKKAVIEAFRGAVADLGALPDIKGAESMKAARAQRREDEMARARLKEAARTLSGKTLNIFIATDLSVAEKMSMAPLALRTEQIFVRGSDIGDPTKLEAAIRVPLIALTGGAKGVEKGPGGEMRETSVQGLTDEQTKEAILHELVHVMLINRGASAVQIWQSSMAGVVSGPPDVKSLAEDVIFRYVRAQEEIFVYEAIAKVYSAFKANKDHYELLASGVEAFLKTIGAKFEAPKSIKIDVKEKIGEEKKKEDVSWSIGYKLPKAVKVDKTHIDLLKTLQKFDMGS